MKILVVFCIFQLYLLPQGDAGKGCSISVKRHFTKNNEPLILQGGRNRYQLLVPEIHNNELTIDLRAGDSVLLVCSGKNNHLINTNTPTALAICDEGTNVLVNNIKTQFASLECKDRASPTIFNTNKQCANKKGTLLDIGFEDGTSQDPVILIQVCHNINLGLTYYTTHTIFGGSINKKVTSKHPSFFGKGDRFVSDLFKGYKVNDDYEKANQEVVFKQLFGATKASQYVDQQNKYLARGHLSPDADFILKPWQLFTYFFINVAPQWQSINNGHWKALERDAKSVSSKLDVNMDVATGTHGLMELENKNIYLENRSKLPVPKYFWKILHNPKDNSCMGFISTNNPYLTSDPTPLCTDVCSKYKWPIRHDRPKGYIYCCEYSALKNVIKDVPEFTCTQPMNFPK